MSSDKSYLYRQLETRFGLQRDAIQTFALLDAGASDGELKLRTMIIDEATKELEENLKPLVLYLARLTELREQCSNMNRLLRESRLIDAQSAERKQLCANASRALTEAIDLKRAEVSSCDRRLEEVSQKLDTLSQFQVSVAKKLNSTLQTSTRREPLQTDILGVD